MTETQQTTGTVQAWKLSALIDLTAEGQTVADDDGRTLKAVYADARPPMGSDGFVLDAVRLDVAEALTFDGDAATYLQAVIGPEGVGPALNPAEGEAPTGSPAQAGETFSSGVPHRIGVAVGLAGEAAPVPTAGKVQVTILGRRLG
jgi:hypothetical protein